MDMKLNLEYPGCGISCAIHGYGEFRRESRYCVPDKNIYIQRKL